MTIRQSDSLQKLQTALISLSTLLVTGCFTFLWRINAELALRQEKDNEHDRIIATQQEQIRLLNTEFQNLNVRTAIMESKIKLKENNTQ